MLPSENFFWAKRGIRENKDRMSNISDLSFMLYDIGLPATRRSKLVN